MITRNDPEENFTPGNNYILSCQQARVIGLEIIKL